MFQRITRREVLWRLGSGLGGIALADLLGRDGLLAGTAEGADIAQPRPDLNGGLHHRAKVRRVIQLFMNGGPARWTPSTTSPSWIAATASVRPGQSRRGTDERRAT